MVAPSKRKIFGVSTKNLFFFLFKVYQTANSSQNQSQQPKNGKIINRFHCYPNPIFISTNHRLFYVQFTILKMSTKKN